LLCRSLSSQLISIACPLTLWLFFYVSLIHYSHCIWMSCANMSSHGVNFMSQSRNFICWDAIVSVVAHQAWSDASWGHFLDLLAKNCMNINFWGYLPFFYKFRPSNVSWYQKYTVLVKTAVQIIHSLAFDFSIPLSFYPQQKNYFIVCCLHFSSAIWKCTHIKHIWETLFSSFGISA